MLERERLGRYELVAHLATGGMGRVSIARATGEGGFERHVIIKTLELSDNDDATAMFLDEARLLGLLHHQHIASIYEVARDDEGTLFLVLEYTHGHTAHDVWERALDLNVALPLDFTLTVVSAAAAGLHYAHTKRSPDGQRLKIVHRDVTLSNLMLGFDGSIKVIDFGIAKAAMRATQTQAGYVKGKLGYMAPEQLRGQAVDPRTDVFALGIVLYELVTMRRAFREESDRATIERIKAGKFVRPRDVVPDCPPELEDVIVKALRTDPAQRYQDADSMRRDIEALGHRMRMVLGDAAVVEVMTQLFEDRAEPWQRRATTRLESEVDMVAEWDDPHGKATVAVTTPQLRPGTELAETLVIAEERERGSTLPPGLTGRDAKVTTSPPERPSERLDSATTNPRGEVAIRINTPSAPPPLADDLPRKVTNSSGELIAMGPRPKAESDPPETKPVSAKEPPKPEKAKPEKKKKNDEAIKKTEHIKARKPGKSSSSSKIWLLIGVLALLGGALSFLIYRPDDRNASAGNGSSQAGTGSATTPPPPADAAVKQSPPPPPPPVRPPPTTVKLVITSNPSDATVLLDDKKLGHTPWEGDVPIDTGKHVLKLRKSRYAPQVRDIELTKDLKEDFVLHRASNDGGE